MPTYNPRVSGSWGVWAITATFPLTLMAEKMDVGCSRTHECCDESLCLHATPCPRASAKPSTKPLVKHWPRPHLSSSQTVARTRLCNAYPNTRTPHAPLSHYNWLCHHLDHKNGGHNNNGQWGTTCVLNLGEMSCPGISEPWHDLLLIPRSVPCGSQGHGHPSAAVVACLLMPHLGPEPARFCWGPSSLNLLQ